MKDCKETHNTGLNKIHLKNDGFIGRFLIAVRNLLFFLQLKPREKNESKFLKLTVTKKINLVSYR